MAPALPAELWLYVAEHLAIVAFPPGLGFHETQEAIHKSNKRNSLETRRCM